ncbi:MAG: hypothetical protein K2F79_01915, partial [Muribaculaceae bacterium]|nr:hypothetical protein [Muribaculaceae bacterium]
MVELHDINKEEAECMLVDQCLALVLDGQEIDSDKARALAELSTPGGRKALEDAAAKVHSTFGNGLFDLCSII